MFEWRKIWANGLPNEGRSPKSGHRMATDGMQFSWRWNGGTISTVLDVIWGMSAQMPRTERIEFFVDIHRRLLPVRLFVIPRVSARHSQGVYSPAPDCG